MHYHLSRNTHLHKRQDHQHQVYQPHPKHSPRPHPRIQARKAPASRLVALPCLGPLVRRVPPAALPAAAGVVDAQREEHGGDRQPHEHHLDDADQDEVGALRWEGDTGAREEDAAVEVLGEGGGDCDERDLDGG